MKVRLYTDDEIKKLKQCVFVRNIKYKREIEYDPVFKLWTIMMKHDMPELITKVTDNNDVVYDSFKMQLLDYVLKRLKEINFDENR